MKVRFTIVHLSTGCASSSCALDSLGQRLLVVASRSYHQSRRSGYCQLFNILDLSCFAIVVVRLLFGFMSPTNLVAHWSPLVQELLDFRGATLVVWKTTMPERIYLLTSDCAGACSAAQIRLFWFGFATFQLLLTFSQSLTLISLIVKINPQNSYNHSKVKVEWEKIQDLIWFNKCAYIHG